MQSPISTITSRHPPRASSGIGRPPFAHHHRLDHNHPTSIPHFLAHKSERSILATQVTHAIQVSAQFDPSGMTDVYRGPAGNSIGDIPPPGCSRAIWRGGYIVGWAPCGPSDGGGAPGAGGSQGGGVGSRSGSGSGSGAGAGSGNGLPPIGDFTQPSANDYMMCKLSSIGRFVVKQMTFGLGALEPDWIDIGAKTVEIGGKRVGQPYSNIARVGGAASRAAPWVAGGNILIEAYPLGTDDDAMCKSAAGFR